MNQKYLIPIAVGVGFFLLVLVASLLFMNGYTEGSAGVVATAAGAAELARRRRVGSIEELDKVVTESDSDVEDVSKIIDEAEATMASNEAEVKDSSLSDLVDEENKRAT